jgi:hypothetical protein
MGTLDVKIASTSVQVYEGSFDMDDSIKQASTLMFRVRDDSGANHYTKGQPVSITDSVNGVLYTGFVATAIEDRESPAILIKTDTGVRDNHYLVEKRTYDGPEFTNTPAGAIFCQLLNVLSQEGITAKYAADRDATATDFNAGTLSGVIGASNVGDGDLELSLAGSVVTLLEHVTSDFSSGTLTNVTAASNTLAPTATSSVKLVAKCSQPGSTNAYTYVKFWSGSHAVPTSDTFSYDIWIDPSSPTGQMGLDILFTDGNSWRDTSNVADFQDVGAHPKNDVSPMAIGQWYHRSFDFTQYNGKTVQSVQIVSEGDTVGIYTCWVKNVQFNGSFFNFAKNTTQHLLNNGYSSSIVTTPNTYDLSGAVRVSNAKDISAASLIGNSLVNWNATQPTGTLFVLKISYDNGLTYQVCTNNAPLPNLPAGATISGMTLCLLAEEFIYDPSMKVGTANPEQKLLLNAVKITVDPTYNASKSDVAYTVATSAAWTAGTLTNLSNFSGADLTLNGYTRNWDDGNATSQTMFGVSTPSSIADRQAFHILLATGSDARSRQDYVGNQQDFTCEVDVLVDNANASIGIVYRTTHWENNDKTYAYMAEVTLGAIKLQRGTNSATTTLTMISNVALSVSSGNWHRLKVVVAGSNHKVYLDDVLYINATDATFGATGGIALRTWNGTGSNYTAFFDNFGVAPALTGTWVSGNQSLAGASLYGDSIITWRDISSDASNTDTLLVESQVDGSTYQTCTNGGPIPNLTPGQNLAAVNLKLRVTLTTSTITTMPGIDYLVARVLGQFNASGNRISPALSLANVGQLGGSVIAWNAVLPGDCTLGVDTRIDAGSWTDQSAQNGQAIAGMTAQGAPVVDTFGSTGTIISFIPRVFAGTIITSLPGDSHVNYSLTNNGGANLTATYDTANSRVTLSGGNVAFYVNNLVSGISDVDMLVDMDEADNGGMIWHYIDTNNVYELLVRDGSATGSPQNSITLFRILAGTRTQVAQVTGINWIRGTYKRFRVTMIGSVITAYMDGVQMLTYTDATPVGAGKCGLRNSITGTGISRYYQLRFNQLGQDVSAHTLQTRLRLASTNPLATPQVQDVNLVAFGTTIAAGALIPQTAMYHQYMDKNIADLATPSNFWWNIDKNRVPYFLPQNALPAPWIASDGGSPVSGLAQGDFLDANITVEDASDLYRNREIVENVLGSLTINETRLGDGVSTSWTFGDQWAGAPTITITNLTSGAVSVGTVGVKNVDTGKQFYYAVGDNTITEDSSVPLYDFTFSLNFTGPGQYLTYSQYDDIAGQAARAAMEGVGTGIVTHVTDGTGLTKAQGDLLAPALVVQNGLGRLLKATTRRFGLTPGQILSVFLTAHNVWNGQFLIRSVKTTLTTEGPTGSMVQQGWYQIEACSGSDAGDWSRLYKRT